MHQLSCTWGLEEVYTVPIFTIAGVCQSCQHLGKRGPGMSQHRMQEVHFQYEVGFSATEVRLLPGLQLGTHCCYFTASHQSRDKLRQLSQEAVEGGVVPGSIPDILWGSQLPRSCPLSLLSHGWPCCHMGGFLRPGCQPPCDKLR